MTELCCIGRLAGDGTEDDPQRVHFQGRSMVEHDRLEASIPTRPNGKALHAIVPCFAAVADPSDLIADVDTEIIAEVAALDGSPSAAEKRRLQRIADRHSLGTVQRPRDLIARLGRKLDPHFDERVHLGRGKAPKPGSFGLDTFTDTAGVDLTAHTADDAGTWTEHTSYTAGQGMISDVNRARSNNTNTATLYHSGSPTSAAYDVQGTVFQISDAGQSGVVGRVDTGANTMYTGIYNASNVHKLQKIVAASTTDLGSWAETLADGNSRVLVLELRDAAKKLYVAGVEQISSADNVITAAGKAGVQLGGNATNLARLHMDSYSASDAVVAGGARRHLSLLGVG